MEKSTRSAGLALAVCGLIAGACSQQEEPAPAAAEKPAPAAQVDDARLLAAADDGANWLSYGRTHDEQRF